MTTREVLKVLDEREALARILAAGYTKHACEPCAGTGHLDSAPARSFRDDPNRVRRVCGKCYGAGHTWAAPKSQP